MRYCGIDKWRLPTLEEALSLLLCYHARGKNSSSAFEDGVFWTADTRGPIREYNEGMSVGDVWVVQRGSVPDILPPGQEARVKCVTSWAPRHRLTTPLQATR